MKKYYILFVIKIIVGLLLISTCTQSGMEYSLVGTWEGNLKYTVQVAGIDYSYNIDVTLIIKSDDNGKFENKDTETDIEYNSTFKIIKSDMCAKTIQIEYDKDSWDNYNGTFKYYLNCNNLIIYDFIIAYDDNGKVKKDLNLSK